MGRFMNGRPARLALAALALAGILAIAGCAGSSQTSTSGAESGGAQGAALSLDWQVGGREQAVEVEEGAYYYDVEHVVTYLALLDELPENYLTKDEARGLGWEGGTPERYREGSAIGGDRFGNYEGVLPSGGGVSYRECDIDTDGASGRGAKRLIWSSDDRYFYSEDHYESFVEYVVEDGEVTEGEAF